jgi:hypothetical protein
LLLLLRDGCDEPADSDVARRSPRRERDKLLSLLLSLRDRRRFCRPTLRFLRRERLRLRLRLVLPRLSSLSLSLLLLLCRLRRRPLAGRRRSESRWSESLPSLSLTERFRRAGSLSEEDSLRRFRRRSRTFPSPSLLGSDLCR